ncbi:TIGR03084 family protein [Gordonia oryzae]|uniref:TIGR03084 family protein n=1 Tax=Gordonia oryzae TaxID=2487349 RepID=A0A3N4H0I2_9ACTN|nr:TIGR03084 family metal-binding protein [Gordonia oryzae]RPA64861.1 TIGR03084 family protein [Gordonia oryzae]
MSRTEVVAGLVADLSAEAAALQEILATLDDADWDIDTAAVGWTIRDQIAHLAHFDSITRLAIADPVAFESLRDDDVDDLQSYVDEVGARYADRTGTEMLQWWRSESAELTAAMLAADPAQRVPWFGPAMSLPSKITARIMETWAHGQDVADALGVVREPTDRLQNVCRIGVLALPNSFRTRGLDVPTVPVFVELTAPDSRSVWQWGDPAATDSVRGSALDFCLVVTQRRHRDDTALEISGAVADQWMTIAQAFAGPAGQGRDPGQFAPPAADQGTPNNDRPGAL